MALATVRSVVVPVSSPDFVDANPQSAAITVPTSSVSRLLVRTETISATSSVAPATVRSVVVPVSTPNFVDAHCHLDRLMSRVAPAFSVFPILRVMVFRNQHLLACVTNFCDVAWLLRHEGLFRDFLSFDRVYGTIGCHPSGASELSHRAVQRLCCLLQHAKVKAVGEIGLDYHHHPSQEQRGCQEKVFRTMLSLAVEIRLPVVVHCREAYEHCLEILREVLPTGWKVHFHCFSSSWMVAKEWLRNYPNSFLGLTPPVEWDRQPYLDLANNVPLDRLLLETDAPYFTQRGKDHSMPEGAMRVARSIADLRGITIEKVCHTTTRNAKVFYGRHQLLRS